jgi:hypothetical protein
MEDTSRDLLTRPMPQHSEPSIACTPYRADEQLSNKFLFILSFRPIEVQF